VDAIPYANAIKSLNKKEFSTVDHNNQDNMKSCAICLMDYEESDEIAELKCDQRHYFHSACLQDWLKKKLECPLCKRPVNPN
jgi:E3 ubiquitin-protein ligase DOA10